MQQHQHAVTDHDWFKTELFARAGGGEGQA